MNCTDCKKEITEWHELNADVSSKIQLNHVLYPEIQLKIYLCTDCYKELSDYIDNYLTNVSIGTVKEKYK